MVVIRAQAAGHLAVQRVQIPMRLAIVADIITALLVRLAEQLVLMEHPQTIPVTLAVHTRLRMVCALHGRAELVRVIPARMGHIIQVVQVERDAMILNGLPPQTIVQAEDR